MVDIQQTEGVIRFLEALTVFGIQWAIIIYLLRDSAFWRDYSLRKVERDEARRTD